MLPIAPNIIIEYLKKFYSTYFTIKEPALISMYFRNCQWEFLAVPFHFVLQKSIFNSIIFVLA